MTKENNILKLAKINTVLGGCIYFIGVMTNITNILVIGGLMLVLAHIDYRVVDIFERLKHE